MIGANIGPTAPCTDPPVETPYVLPGTIAAEIEELGALTGTRAMRAQTGSESRLPDVEQVSGTGQSF